MTHFFEMIEDAAVAALTPPLKAIGVTKIEPYAGQLGQAGELVSQANRLPAVWVICGDNNVATVNTAQRLSIELCVIIAAKSVRGVNTSAKGAKNPGAYDILEVVRQTLNNQQVLPQFAPPQLFFEGAALSDPTRGLAVYTANFNLQTQLRGY